MVQVVVEAVVRRHACSHAWVARRCPARREDRARDDVEREVHVSTHGLHMHIEPRGCLL